MVGEAAQYPEENPKMSVDDQYSVYSDKADFRFRCAEILDTKRATTAWGRLDDCIGDSSGESQAANLISNAIFRPFVNMLRELLYD